ncbi:hypothetical protein [Micromonospora sp. NPDC005172]
MARRSSSSPTSAVEETLEHVTAALRDFPRAAHALALGRAGLAAASRSAV